MVYGWLVVNKYLQSGKFEEIYEWLQRAARQNKVSLQRFTNDQLLIDLQEDPDISDRPAFVLFWDKDIRLAEYLENLGLRLFNRADAINACDDKAITHIRLACKGLPTPATIVAPMTFDNIGYSNYDFLDRVIERLDLPMVIKTARGSFGKNVFLVRTREEAVEAISAIGSHSMIFQEFIETSAGTDLRLQVVGDEVIGAMRRSAGAGEFRANLTLGGTMEAYEPTQQQKTLAVKACHTLGLDFAGVDMLFGPGNVPLICEINSNAHFVTLHQCTGVDAADAIIRHIVKQLTLTTDI